LPGHIESGVERVQYEGRSPSRLGAFLIAVGLATPVQGQELGDWPAYGHDQLGTRLSPLTQITRDNVGGLAVAWRYRTNERAIRETPRLEATPLVVDGMMFLSTPFGRAIALDPLTGAELWTYDAGGDRGGDWGDFASRGVATWLDADAAPSAHCRRRIYLPVIDGRIVALDARQGTPCTDFGVAGTVHLRDSLRNEPFYVEEYELTSPPAVIGGLIVTGSAVADNNRTNAASGEVRAYDARTGALRWSWDPVPRARSDPAWDTWGGPMARSTGAANAWTVLAADAARDLVFVPTGSPSPDYYGGERLGDNRYANSIVALRASTGEVVWHFQTVHHDLWDYDNASPPALVTITREGRPVDVVLQATKSGQLFVLDRETGVPVFPVEERPVPQSSIFGERASPTQPFNTVIPPLSPMRFTEADIWAPTPEIRERCAALLRPMRNEGPFTPPSLEGSVVIPSNVGGAHWGGLSFDPLRQIAVVPVNTIAARVQLIRLDEVDTVQVRENRSRLGDEYTRMHGTPYVMRRNMINTTNGLPCTPPPFGRLVAIDLATGAKTWDVPLGDLAALRGDLGSELVSPTGTPNLGGPIVTASGLVFIGAAMDHVLRAFDVETGRELWKGPLPGGARATPMTYEAGGRQFVVVCVGGGDEWGNGDYVVAFALPGA
jgi:quinoprotein glucose dehydrogenase